MGDLMVPILQDMYVVLTGDLISSRELEDRAKVQEGLKNALTINNKRFKGAIVAKFIVVRGDSFQGMMSSPKYLFDLYYALFENIRYQFYLGVGIGSISTHLSENVGEMDGKAFHRAFNALERAKRESAWIKFKSGWEIDEIVTCLLNFTADVMWSWTERQEEVVMHYKRAKSSRGGTTLEEIADDMGVTKQTVSKILKRSKYRMIEEAERSFMDFINQKWLTEEYKPKMADKGE